MFERGEQIRIRFHRRQSGRIADRDVLPESTPLLVGIRQFTITVGQLYAVEKYFEAFGEFRFVRIETSQGGLVGRVMVNYR